MGAPASRRPVPPQTPTISFRIRGKEPIYFAPGTDVVGPPWTPCRLHSHSLLSRVASGSPGGDAMPGSGPLGTAAGRASSAASGTESISSDAGIADPVTGT